MSLEKIDAIILCGGLGKRLRTAIGEQQKTLALINDKPFLNIIINSLRKQGVRRIILLTGYKADELEKYYLKNPQGLELIFSREKEPLGTGGALKQAKKFIRSENFFMLNGDSFCDVDYVKLLTFHLESHSLATMVVAEVKDNREYGGVVLNKNDCIEAFTEKDSNIRVKTVNAGVYCFHQDVFKYFPRRKKISLEYDVFTKLVKHRFFGYKTKKKFYDIGTPEKFELAKKFFKSLR